MKKIPYGRQNITDEDIEAVVIVLKSDFLTQGPSIKLFEDAFAKYVGTKYAIAVSNGTAALHLCTSSAVSPCATVSIFIACLMYCSRTDGRRLRDRQQTRAPRLRARGMAQQRSR